MSHEHYRYTKEHQWLQDLGGGTFRIGITPFAIEQLGDPVHVELPEVGSDLAQGDTLGCVESTKTVSDVTMPVGGRVTAINAALLTRPEQVAQSPLQDGWLLEIATDADTFTSSCELLLDETAYRSYTEVGH